MEAPYCRTILYLGTNTGSSRHRALALQRLGNEVHIVDPRDYLPKGRMVEKWIFETGAFFLEDIVRHRVLANLPEAKIDFVFVDAGDLVGPRLVTELKRRFGTVINYNIDDPYGPRDARKWRLYLQAVPYYDLVVVVRKPNISEAMSRGANNVLHVYRAADEIAHARRRITEDDRKRWAADVSFIGTWMPERGPLMARLIELGVPLSIFGNRWQRAKEWPLIRSHWCGPGIDRDDDYSTAVQCAKICLGLVSKGNRDLSTQRSFEIPYMGRPLCAERTSEHSELYHDRAEAAFWSTPEECAAVCNDLLRNDSKRERMAENGRQRCLRNRSTNEHVLTEILEATGVKALAYEAGTR